MHIFRATPYQARPYIRIPYSGKVKSILKSVLNAVFKRVRLKYKLPDTPALLKRLSPLYTKYKILNTKRRRVLPYLALVALALGGFVLLRSTREAQAVAWWPSGGNWAHRKQLTITNNSGDDLAANTTVAITVDTKSLYDAGKLQSGCEDIRILYQPDSSTYVNVDRHPVVASGTTCATSTATKIYFPLQSAVSDGSSDTGYYLYYANPSTSAPSDTENAFDIDDANATLVCPFNGTTDCVAGETPSTETGAIRYSGSKSALKLASEYAATSYDSSLYSNTALTVELWHKSNGLPTAFNSASILIKGYTAGTYDYGLSKVWDDNIRKAAFSINAGADGARSETNVSDGEWHHIAGVWDGTTVKVYVDGVVGSTVDNNATMDGDNSAGIGIGAYTGGANPGTDAVLDEIRISNTARYTSDFTPPTAPFVRDEYTMALYHMDEGGDTPWQSGKIIDDSGNGNHGAITGATYSTGLVGVDNGTTDTGYQYSQSYAGHEGIFIEEDTTNKITNPSFEHATYDTNWSINPAGLNYDSTNDYFTASLAKRNSAGPFAAGPAVQGSLNSAGQGEVISYDTSTAISGSFRTTMDGDRGTVVLWHTPENASTYTGPGGGSDTEHLFVYGTGYQDMLRTYHAAYANRLYFVVYDQSFYASYDPTDGNTYSIVLRWDTVNTLDGTNYASITIDNVTTYGITSAPTVTSHDNAYIGAGVNSFYIAKAILEGTTIYRRPLYGGSDDYGVDVGNGDEVEAIYNGGTGEDPTLTTGSWDVVFALPTNASTGALSTGTGEAWSHPHSSNLLYTSTTNTGGFMMNGTYTNDGWADEGTPSSVAALATGEKIYSGGYKTTSDAANEGLYYDETVSEYDDWVIRALGHSDGTCDPKVILYDQTNTAEIGSLAGTTSSTRTDPDVYIFTGEAPAGSTTLRVKLINTASSGTCYWHQVEVLDNLYTNASMESGSGNPWIPTDWNNLNLTTDDSSKETSVVHTGSSSFKYNDVIRTKGISSNSFPRTANKFYSFGVWGNVTAANNVQIYTAYTSSFRSQHTSNTNVLPLNHVSVTSGWEHFMGVRRALNTGSTTNSGYQVHGWSGASYKLTGYVDDLYAFQLDDVSLTVTPANETYSTETSGLRVDGTDTLTQTITELGTVSGQISFKYTPRHSFSTADLFGNTTPVIAEFYGDADDYIKLYRADDSTLRLQGLFNSTTVNADYSSPTLDAATTYTFDITYTGGGSLVLKVNGTQQATQSGIPAGGFSTAPTTAYFGSDSSGLNQYDGTIDAATVSYASKSENTSAPYYKFGSKSTYLAGSDDYASKYTIAIDPDSAANHVLSAYVYDGTTGAVGTTIDGTDASLIFEDSNVTTTYTDMGGGWWRLSYSGATTDASNNYGVYIVPGKDMYVDGVQLEQNNGWTTSYTDGTLGTGYSWSGTAHESTSTRNAGVLSYASAGNVSGSAGTASVWVKFNEYNDAREIDIFRYGLQLYKPSSYGNNWYVDGMGAPTYNYAPSAGEWVHFVVTWDSSVGATLYVNNDTNGTGDPFSAPSISQWQLGGHSGQSYTNGTFSDMRIYDAPISAAEVADLYYSGLASHQEGTEVDTFGGGTTAGEPASAIWHMDEGTGTTLNDASPTGTNDATLYPPAGGGPTWQSEDMCIKGKCLSFDGSDDYVAGDTSLSGVKTVSFWVKSGSSTDYFFDASGSEYIWSNNGTLTATGFTSPTIYINGIAGTSLSTNSWEHVTVTTDTGVSASDINLGWVGSNYFQGHMDEVRIHPYALTADQVKTQYNLASSEVLGTQFGLSTENSLSNGLVGYWKMDESSDGSGQVDRSDSSGNSFTLTDTNTVPSTSGKFGSAGSFTRANNEHLRRTSMDILDSAEQTSVSFWASSSLAGGQNGTPLKIGSSNYNMLVYWTTSSTPGYSYLRVYMDGVNGAATTQSGSLPDLGDASWKHISIVFDGTGSSNADRLKIFIDGTQQDLTITGTIPSSMIPAGTQTWDIGCINPGTNGFTGKIDEFRIYNRALSPAEVQKLYEWAPGPIAHFNMDEASGTAIYDSSGTGYTGNFGSDSAAPTWSAGKYGGAVLFDGTDDFILIPTDPLQNVYNWTIESWFYSTSSNMSWLLAGGGSRYVATGTNGINFNWNPSTGGGLNVSSPTITTNTWHHLAVRYDGSYLSFFLDGEEGNSTAGAGRYSTTSNTIYLGRGCGACWQTGKTDEFKIYNYPRTQEQIVEDMNAGHPGVGSPVGHAIGEWSFDEGYGTNANDSGLGGNNGTLANLASPATSTSGWQNEDNCKKGKCLWFDGTDDYVEVGAGPSEVNSASFWVHPGSPTEYLMNFTGTTDYIWIDNGTVTATGFTSPTIYVDGVTTTTITSGSWHHVVVTTATAENASALRLGRVNGSDYLNGRLDEVKLYNFELSSDEVKQLKNFGYAQVLGYKSGTSDMGYEYDTSNPWWYVEGKTAEGAWNAAAADDLNDSYIDLTGNGNTLTASGSPEWRSGAGWYFDGSDYLATGLTPDEDWTMIVQFSSQIHSPDTAIGSEGTGDTKFYIQADQYSYDLGHGDTETASLGVTAGYRGEWAALRGSAGQNISTSLEFDSSWSGTPAEIHIGRRNSTVTTADWVGNIQHVAIYSDTLTEAEVQQVMNAGEADSEQGFTPLTDSDLISYWRFSNIDNEVKDLISSYDLTNHNNADWVYNYSYLRNGMAFDDASSQYLDITDASAPDLDFGSSDSWTVIFYGRDYYNEPDHRMIGKAGAWDGTTGPFALEKHTIGYSTTSALRIYNGSTYDELELTHGSNGRWIYNMWHASYDADTQTMRIGMNDTPIASKVSSIQPAASSEDFSIAGSDLGDYYTGTIIAAAVFNKALSDDEVAWLYNRGRYRDIQEFYTPTAPGTANLMEHWSFEEDGPDFTGDHAGYVLSTHDPSYPVGTVSNGLKGKAADFGIAGDRKRLRMYSEAGGGDFSMDQGPFTVCSWRYVDPDAGHTTFGTWDYQWMLRNSSTSAQHGLFPITNGISLYATEVSPSQTKTLDTTQLASFDAFDDQWTWMCMWTDTVSGDIGMETSVYKDRVITSITGNIDGGDFMSTDQVWINGYTFHGRDGSGYFDQYVVFDDILTPAERAWLYNDGEGRSYAELVNSSSTTTTYKPPVAEWKLDENTGANAYDTSGNDYTGVIDGATWTVGANGKGQALSFDGTDDYVFLSNTTTLKPNESAWTTSLWFKAPDADSSKPLLTKRLNSSPYNQWGLFTGSINSGGVQFASKKICVTMIETGISEWLGCNTDADIIDGNWHYVSVVRDDSGNPLIYVDGALEPHTCTFDAGTKPYNINNDVHWQLGFNNDSSYYEGDIDQIKIWDYALSPKQIAYEYDGGEPQVWFKFDECTGTTANDNSTGGSYDGIISIGGSGSNTSAGNCGSGTGSEAWNNGTSGKFNYSLDFDGTDDYVEVGTGPTSVYATSFWVKPATTTEYFVNYTGTTDYIWADSGTITTTGIPTSAIYVNGVASTSISSSTWQHVVVTTDYSENASALRIGRVAGSNYLDGQMDDVKIFSYPLTVSDVKKLYNEGSSVRFGPAEGSP